VGYKIVQTMYITCYNNLVLKKSIAKGKNCFSINVGLPQSDQNNCRDATPTDSRDVIMEPVNEVSTIGSAELSVDEQMQKESISVHLAK
jgi:hypothetical protein